MNELKDCEATDPIVEPSAATVAVIIATYNRAHLIGETIESILAQSHPAHEFIVVNDGSTDNTGAVVAGFGDRIRYVEKANGGKSSALNLVIPSVESDYICIFDDDDIMLGDALQTHAQFLATHRNYDFSYAPNYVFENSAQIESITRQFPTPMPYIPTERFFLWVMESPFLPAYMSGMMIPTECFRQIGIFDLALTRSQDRDMVIRVARHFRAGRIDKPLWAVREHSGARGPSFDRHQESERYAVWWRHKQRVFGKLRESVSLEEYIDPAQVPAPDSPNRKLCIQRKGLLKRSIIMATHGLLDEAIADFSAYCKITRNIQMTPDAQELRQISRLNHILTDGTTSSCRFYHTIGTLSGSHRALFSACVRGLYWSWRRELAKGQYLSNLRIAVSATSLCAGRVWPPLRKSDAR